MARLWDWQERYEATLTAWAKRTHTWGEADCALFASAVVEALTGSDPSEAYKGQYSDPLSGLRLLKKIKADGLESLAASLFQEVPVGLAQRGDIAIMEAAGTKAEQQIGALGVFDGEWVIKMNVTGDLAMFERSAAVRAYRVE